MKIMITEGGVRPTRAHPYDAGLDLYMPKDIASETIHPYGGSVTIDTKTHVAIPQHFCGFVKSKSGLLTKYKIFTDGVVDCEYTGSIHVTLVNHGEESYTFRPGDKIAQLVILPCCLPVLEDVDFMECTVRGNNGFGSTGR